MDEKTRNRKDSQMQRKGKREKKPGSRKEIRTTGSKHHPLGLLFLSHLPFLLPWLTFSFTLQGSPRLRSAAFSTSASATLRRRLPLCLSQPLERPPSPASMQRSALLYPAPPHRPAPRPLWRRFATERLPPPLPKL